MWGGGVKGGKSLALVELTIALLKLTLALVELSLALFELSLALLDLSLAGFVPGVSDFVSMSFMAGRKIFPVLFFNSKDCS